MSWWQSESGAAEAAKLAIAALACLIIVCVGAYWFIMVFLGR